MGDFTQACNDGTSSSANVVTVTEMQKASAYVPLGSLPPDFQGAFGLNNPDPGAPMDANSTAHDFATGKCGLGGKINGATDTGWVLRGDDPTFGASGWSVPDAQGGRTEQVYWTRTIGYQFDTSDPGNQPADGPGQGAAHTQTGPPQSGPGSPVSGCTWTIDESVQAGDWLKVDALSGGSGCTANSMMGLSIQCFDNGAYVGGKNSADQAAEGTLFDAAPWQIPAAANRCTITTWTGNWDGNKLSPTSAHVAVWDPTHGLQVVGWKALSTLTGTHAPLNPPTKVHVTAGGLVSWTPVSGAAYYAVSRDDNTSTATMQAVDGSQTSFQDTLSDGKAHTYTVAAQPDPFPAQQAPWSAVATEPPLNVHYALGTVSWDPVVAHDQAGGYYNIYVNGGKFAQVAGTTSFTFPDSPSAAGNAYSVTVTSAGSVLDMSDQSVPTTITYLAPPTGLATNGACGGQTLQWSPDYSKIIKYNVYRNGTELKTGITGTSYTDTTTTPGTSYTYRVSAVAPDGSESLWSSPLTNPAC
jgi:hypothetical protein